MKSSGFSYLATSLMSHTIYVSNIDYTAGTKELAEAVSKFGKVLNARIITERIRGQTVSRGIGFVEFETEQAMKAAVDSKEQTLINNRALRIAAARPKQPKDCAFVAHLAAGTTKENLIEAFKANNSKDAKVIVSKSNPQVIFGFVQFATAQDCEAVVKARTPVKINGADVVIRFAHKFFNQRPRRTRRYYRRAPTGK